MSLVAHLPSPCSYQHYPWFAWSSSRSEAPHPEYTAIVSGPFWTIPMRETELQEFVELLGQLRRVVQQLDGAGQWLPGSADRPASRIKVGDLLHWRTHCDCIHEGPCNCDCSQPATAYTLSLSTCVASSAAVMQVLVNAGSA